MRTPTIPMPQVPSAARTAPQGAPQAAPRATRNATDVAMTAARKMLAAGAMSDALWAPFVSAVLVLAAGSLALATGRPWLFAALGPTAVLLAANPGHPTTRFHAIVVGHLVAVACAWIAVMLMGAGDAPTLLGGAGLSVARVWASAFAIGMMMAIQPSLKAYHPPAAATALLLTLGVHRTGMSTMLALLGGVLVVAILGEWFQRVRLRQQRTLAA